MLTVQHESLITHQFQTTLTRVCKNDDTFDSYTEVKLLCLKESGTDVFYNRATAATMKKIGNDLGKR